MSKQATTWTIVIVVILIILGLVFWSSNDSDLETPEPAPAADNGEISGIVGENEITIGDQEASSRTAVASYVFLQDDGYVAVHERGANGRPAAVLGASARLSAGQTLNVSIPLSSALVADRTYIAMLHLDNGDGTFNEASDPVAQEAGGDEVLVEFTAKASAE